MDFNKEKKRAAVALFVKTTENFHPYVSIFCWKWANNEDDSDETINYFYNIYNDLLFGNLPEITSVNEINSLEDYFSKMNKGKMICIFIQTFYYNPILLKADRRFLKLIFNKCLARGDEQKYLKVATTRFTFKKIDVLFVQDEVSSSEMIEMKKIIIRGLISLQYCYKNYIFPNLTKIHNFSIFNKKSNFPLKYICDFYLKAIFNISNYNRCFSFIIRSKNLKRILYKSNCRRINDNFKEILMIHYKNNCLYEYCFSF